MGILFQSSVTSRLLESWLVAALPHTLVITVPAFASSVTPRPTVTQIWVASDCCSGTQQKKERKKETKFSPQKNSPLLLTRGSSFHQLHPFSGVSLRCVHGRHMCRRLAVAVSLFDLLHCPRRLDANGGPLLPPPLLLLLLSPRPQTAKFLSTASRSPGVCAR